MSNLSALQQLNAAGNLFKGRCMHCMSPVVHAQSILRKKQRKHPHAHLTGPLPDSWAAMRSLRSVVLSGNLLTGTLPSEWGDMLLQYLVLDNNRLGGWLPPSWGSMSFLRVLSLGMVE